MRIYKDLQTLEKGAYKKRLLQKHSAIEDHFEFSTEINEINLNNNNNNKMHANQIQSSLESDKLQQTGEKSKIKETLLNAVEFELQALNNNNYNRSESHKIDGDNMQDANAGKSAAAVGKHNLPQIVQDIPIRRNSKTFNSLIGHNLENINSKKVIDNSPQQSRTIKAKLDSSFSVNEILNKSTMNHINNNNVNQMEADFDNVPMNLSTHSGAIDYSKEHVQNHTATQNVASDLTTNALPSTSFIQSNPETVTSLKVQTLRNPEELRKIDDGLRYNSFMRNWPLYQQNPNAAREVNTNHPHSFHPYDRMFYQTQSTNGYIPPPTAAKKNERPVKPTKDPDLSRPKRKYVRKQPKKNESYLEQNTPLANPQNNLIFQPEYAPGPSTMPFVPTSSNPIVSREQMNLYKAMQRIPQVNYSSANRSKDLLSIPSTSRDTSFSQSQSSTSSFDQPRHNYPQNSAISIDGLGKDMTVYRVPYSSQNLNENKSLPIENVPAENAGVRRGRPPKPVDTRDVTRQMNEYALEVARKLNETESARMRANYFTQNYMRSSNGQMMASHSSNLMTMQRPQPSVPSGSQLYPSANFNKLPHHQSYLQTLAPLLPQYPYGNFEQNPAQINGKFTERSYAIPYSLNSNIPNLSNLRNNDTIQSSVAESIPPIRNNYQTQNPVPVQPNPLPVNLQAKPPSIPLSSLQGNYSAPVNQQTPSRAPETHAITQKESKPIPEKAPEQASTHQSTPELRNFRISKPRSNANQPQQDSLCTLILDEIDPSVNKQINVYKDPVSGIPVLSIPDVEETVDENQPSTSSSTTNISRKRKSTETQIDMNQIHNFEFLLRTLIHIDTIQNMPRQINSIRSEFKNLRNAIKELNPISEESKKSFDELFENMISVIENKLKLYYHPNTYMDLIDSFKKGTITADMFFENVIGKLMLGAGNIAQNSENDESQTVARYDGSSAVTEVPPNDVEIEFNINKNPEILKSFSNGKIRICDISNEDHILDEDSQYTSDDDYEELNVTILSSTDISSENSLTRKICESDLNIVKNIPSELSGAKKVDSPKNSLLKAICESDLNIVKGLQSGPSRSKSLSPHEGSSKFDRNVSRDEQESQSKAEDSQTLRSKSLSPTKSLLQDHKEPHSDTPLIKRFRADILSPNESSLSNTSVNTNINPNETKFGAPNNAQTLRAKTLSPKANLGDTSAQKLDISDFQRPRARTVSPIGSPLSISQDSKNAKNPRTLQEKAIPPEESISSAQREIIEIQTKNSVVQTCSDKALCSSENSLNKFTPKELRKSHSDDANAKIVIAETPRKEDSLNTSIEKDRKVQTDKSNTQLLAPIVEKEPLLEAKNPRALIAEESSSNLVSVCTVRHSEDSNADMNAPLNTTIENSLNKIQDSTSSKDIIVDTDEDMKDVSEIVVKDEAMEVDSETAEEIAKKETSLNKCDPVAKNSSDSQQIKDNISNSNTDIKKAIMMNRPSIIVENKSSFVDSTRKIPTNNVNDNKSLTINKSPLSNTESSSVIDKLTTCSSNSTKSVEMQMKCKRINEISEKLQLNKKIEDKTITTKPIENHIIESENDKQTELPQSSDNAKDSEEAPDEDIDQSSGSSSLVANAETASTSTKPNSDNTICDINSIQVEDDKDIYAGYVYDRVYRKNVNERYDYVIRYVKDFVTLTPARRLRQIIGDPVYISDDEDSSKKEEGRKAKESDTVSHGNASKENSEVNVGYRKDLKNLPEKGSVIKNTAGVFNVTETNLQESGDVKNEPVPFPMIPSSPTYSLVSVGSPISIIDDEDVQMKDQSITQNEARLEASAKIKDDKLSAKDVDKPPVDSQSRIITNPKSTNDHITNKNLCNHSQISVNKDIAKFNNYKPNFQSTDNNDRIPKGKLSYNREEGWLLRYFDETQQILFGKNVGVGNGLKSGTICKEQRIPLPPYVRFSDKEQLDDPQEYVDELNLVEKYVPLDFYSFYRYVTGYQIFNKNNPISFITFLTLYNTNNLKPLKSAYIRKVANSL